MRLLLFIFTIVLFSVQSDSVYSCSFRRAYTEIESNEIVIKEIIVPFFISIFLIVYTLFSRRFVFKQNLSFFSSRLFRLIKVSFISINFISIILVIAYKAKDVLFFVEDLITEDVPIQETAEPYDYLNRCYPADWTPMNPIGIFYYVFKYKDFINVITILIAVFSLIILSTAIFRYRNTDNNLSAKQNL